MTIPLEKQVVSLEVSKRMRDLGFPQESIFHYYETNKRIEISFYEREYFENKYALRVSDSWAAYTVGELFAFLPAGTSLLKRTDIKTKTIARYYAEVVEPQEKWVYDKDSWDENAANACAKLCCFLKENGLI